VVSPAQHSAWYPSQKLSVAVLILFWIASALALGPPTYPRAQATPPNPARQNKVEARLEPGKPVERTLAGGETQSFIIEAKAGQFMYVHLDQLGIRVDLTLFAPSGTRLATTMERQDDLFPHPPPTTPTWGPREISIISESNGAYELEVASTSRNAPIGRYIISIEPLRAPSTADKARIAAEQDFSEALDTSRLLWNATHSLESSLPLWRAAGDANEEALTRYFLAESYLQLGDTLNAQANCDRAIQLMRGLGERAGEAAVLNVESVILIRLGDNQKALENSRQALLLARTVGSLGNEEARALDNSSVAYLRLGDNQNALSYSNQALPLQLAAGDRAAAATTLARIGELYRYLGDNQKALENSRQALELMRAVGNQVGEGTVLTDIGIVFDAVGDNQKALDYFSQGLSMARSAGNRVGEAYTLNNMGHVFSGFGEFQKALDYFLQAASISRSAGDRAAEALALGNLGIVYECLGDADKSLDNFNRSLSIRRAIGDRPGEAGVLDNIGWFYSLLGETQRPLDYFNQALPLQLAAGDRAAAATTLRNIGDVYVDLKDYQKALDNLNQSLQLARQVGDRVREGQTLNAFGRVYINIGDNQKALDYYNQALNADLATGDLDDQGVELGNIGEVYTKLGDEPRAVKSYGEALLLLRGARDTLNEARALRSVMWLYNTRNKPSLAILFGKQAVNGFQKIRAGMGSLEKQTQQSFLNSNESAYRYLADVLITQGRLPEAQQVLDLLKNEEYFDFIRRDATEGASLTAPVSLTKREEEINHEYEENANRVTAIGNEWASLRAKLSRTPEEEKHLAELSERLRLANEQWANFLSGLYLELGQSKQAEASVEDLQERTSGMQRVLRQLGTGTVALYTLVSDDKYRVIVVTPSVVVAREFPIKAEELRRKVFEFRLALQNPKSNPVPKAQDLYKILVGPISQDLKGARAMTLMWSLDDVLRYVPMSALHDGHDYLVTKYRNEVFTPASELTNSSNPTAWQGLGMGVSKAYGGFRALPAVPDELNSIIRDKNVPRAKGVLPGQMMLDETFTRDTMKKALEHNYPLVHIASHFAFAPGNETDSFLLLGGTDPQGQRLTLAEIRTDPAFSFADTQLLTLSACDTAMGGAAGDGREVDGLGILAQQKGARAVLASLWAVYDSSTGLLMQEFYKRWTTQRSNMPKLEALRQAQLALLRGTTAEWAEDGTRSDYTHPYYWAPFILIGNWR
jgi:CHAT domain-containing protein/Tfp pilus assembly protein PilF